MKRPSLKFDKQAILGFLLNHAEKLVVGLVGLIGLVLLWNGINALRIKSVRSTETPEAVAQLSAATVQHIDAVQKPPADTVRKGGELALAIDPWRPQQVKIATAPAAPLLARPLVAELSKRTKPAVLPLEDLRAIAGVAVLPDVTDPAALMPMGPRPEGIDRPEREPENPRQKPGRRQPRRGEEPQPDVPPMPEFNPMMTTMPRGKVVPYVMVTGLVPVAKQHEEFGRAFGGASFRDPQLDRPRWSQYLVERAVVGPTGAADKWERLKVKNVELFGQGGGMQPMPGNQQPEPMQQEMLPPTFLLGTNDTDIGYVAQLPQRIDEAWGLETIHPWFRTQFKRILAEAAPGLMGDGPAVAIAPQRLKEEADEFAGQIGLISNMQLVGEPQRGGEVVAFAVKSADGAVSFPVEAAGAGKQPVFVMSAAWARSLELDNGPKTDTTCNLRVRIEQLGKMPVARILGITYVEPGGEPGEELVDPSPFPLTAGGMMPGGEFGGGGNWAEGGAGGLDGEEFRLFRFVDMTVKPGQRYRYRVRLSLRNPNFGVDQRHLSDPTSSRGELIPSKESNETPPVAVPDAMAILVQTLSKDEIKQMKLKTGSVQVLVLAPSSETGNYSLRSLLTEVGGLANIDSALNKPGDTRTKGENVTTDRVLVDIRGRQEEPAKIGNPPETLEMLFLKPDGTCEVVSAADSQRFYDRYMMTLEPAAGTDAGTDGGPGAPGIGNPFEFGSPRGGNK
jgi:hypothetical protein